MELSVAWRVLRVYGWLAVALALVGLLAAAIVTAQQTPVYVSQSQLIVALQTTGSATPNDRVDANRFAEQTAATYADVVPSSPVLQDAISALGIDETPQSLADRIDASSEVESPIVQIRAEADTPENAEALANAVTDSFQNYVETVLEPPVAVKEDEERSTITFGVLQSASLPISADSPNVLVNLGLGLLVGLFLGAALALVLALADRRLRSVGEVERVIGRPVLGVMGLGATGTRRSSEAVPLDESLRAICTNLAFVGRNGAGMSFVVVSTKRGEGAPEAIVGIAKAFAEIGARVMVVDADFALPRVASMFGASGSLGLVDALTRGAKLSDAIVTTEDPQIHTIPAGGVSVASPSRLLGSAQMALVVDELNDAYDVVLFSAQPLLVAADAAVLSSVVRGVVVVAGSGRVSSPELSSAIDSLTNLEVPISGVVVTRRSLLHHRRLDTSSEAMARVATSTQLD